MTVRGEDWFAQADRDLAHAEGSLEEGSHEWACLASHQSVDKAVKALHLHLGQESWGHIVAKLLREFPIEVPGARQLPRARTLPNGHPEGAPFEHYGPRQSEEAIEDAGAIVEFVRSQMASP